MMKKNYKLQDTNYKSQITNKAAPFGQVLNAFGEGDAHEIHELTRIAEKNYNSKITTKGNHGLQPERTLMQTMTALIKSFCRCFTGSRG